MTSRMDIRRYMMKTASTLILNKYIGCTGHRHRVKCLAFELGTQSRRCRRMFSRSRKDHMFCSGACYSKTHRIPGFVRSILRNPD